MPPETLTEYPQGPSPEYEILRDHLGLVYYHAGSDDFGAPHLTQATGARFGVVYRMPRGMYGFCLGDLVRDATADHQGTGIVCGLRKERVYVRWHGFGAEALPANLYVVSYAARPPPTHWFDAIPVPEDVR